MSKYQFLKVISSTADVDGSVCTSEYKTGDIVKIHRELLPENAEVGSIIGVTIGEQLEAYDYGIDEYLNEHIVGELIPDLDSKFVKDWYMTTYPDDKFGDVIDPNCSFWDIYTNIEYVYVLLGVRDSIVRERVFTQLADELGVNYDEIYLKWIESYA